ncbi:MAG TPA: hypothetical protein PLU50_09805 [Pseudobdellovibrionaceae bacterium]|nr:hypothetical protein [Pseudobdellovibrionaceae bacterium]
MGQVIVEYILLMVIVVAIASFLISTVVSRNPDQQGFLIKKWDEMIQAIGKDVPDKCDPRTAGSVGYPCR